MPTKKKARPKASTRFKRLPIEVPSPDLAEFLRRLLSICAPRTPVSPSKWQEEHRFAPPHSPRPGRWKNDPFQVEPLDAIIDTGVSSLTLMWASQFLGKSSIVEGVLAWQIAEAPAACVAVFPTHDNAKIWSKNRFSPLIDSIPVLSRLVEKKRFSKLGRGRGENTIVHKTYPSGWLVAGGANSPAGLAAHTAKVVCFDEVDRYPESVGKEHHEEGDVIILTEQRSARFVDAFSIKTSTPTVKGFSRIEREFEKTDQRKWFVRCPNKKCRHEFVIMWQHIRCPEVKDGEGNVIDYKTAEAYLECPSCANHFSDSARQKMVRAGKWVAGNPKVTNKRGYWANAFLVLGPTKQGFTSWLHYFWDRYLLEKSTGTQGLREWQNLVLGEPYEVETDPPPDFLTLYNRREQYDEFNGEIVLPDRCLLLTVGIDVQRDRVEIETVGWGLNDESWGIEYKILRGNPQLPRFWNNVDELIQRKWRHASGHWLSPYCTLIDTGDKPATMYAFVRRCSPRLVYASKGYQGFTPDWVKRSGGSNQRLFILKVDTPKESLYSNLRLVEYGPGYAHYPSNEGCNYDTAYFDQLTSERLVLTGSYPHFEKRTSHVRNEALDVRVLAMAAREIADPHWEKVMGWVASPPLNDWRPKAPPPPEPPPLPETTMPPSFIKPGAPPKPEPVILVSTAPAGENGVITVIPEPAPRRIKPSGWSKPW